MGSRKKKLRPERKSSKYPLQARGVTKAVVLLNSFIRDRGHDLERLEPHLWSPAVNRVSEATELLKELMQFTVSDLTSLPIREQYKRAMMGRQALINRGIVNEKAADVIADMALRKASGRPETIRHLTSRALALKESRRTLTWPAISQKLAPDNYPVHGTVFADRIRRNVRLLNALLDRIDAFLRVSSADS